MLENKLLACFILLSIIGLIIALIPFRRYKKSIFFLVPVFILLVTACYWTWGGWSLWHSYHEDLSKQERAQAMLQTVKSPQQLINRLKAHIQQKPNSARGWYLLGRLYASQSQWHDAEDAFATAHQLKPEDVNITVNWAQSLFASSDELQHEKARKLLSDLLMRNSNQPDTLAMLAMDAYNRHDYQQAIEYWQRLLALLPAQSEEAQAIRKAIAKAQSQT
ncbi:MAG: hypothetical protein Q8R83_02420 [Legionellaceae bacterium]|nr:hypothetical protein [Legionellaceae bacterium]